MDDIEALNKKPVNLNIKSIFPPYNHAWVVCLTAALFFFYEILQMNMLNVIGYNLMYEFSIAPTQLGIFSASFFYANAIFLLPAGILLDRYSTKKIILTACSLSVLGTLLFACSNFLWLATLGRLIVGLCNAFAFLSCMRLAARWFPSYKLSSVTGVIVTIGMLGGLVAQIPFALLVELVGWHNALFSNSFLGVIILLAIAKNTKDYPTQNNQPHFTKQQLNTFSFLKSLWLSITNIQNWLAGLYTCFNNLPIALLGALWGNIYLMQVHHVTTTQASTISTALFIGIIVGSPTIGWLSDRLQLRKKPMIVGALFLTLALLIISFTKPFSTPYLIIIFFIIGFCSSIQVLGYSYVAEINPTPISSTALGFSSVILLTGCAIFQPLFGLLTNIQAMSIFNKNNPYQVAMLLLPLAAFISSLLAMFFKEKHSNAKLATME